MQRFFYKMIFEAELFELNHAIAKQAIVFKQIDAVNSRIKFFGHWVDPNTGLKLLILIIDLLVSAVNQNIFAKSERNVFAHHVISGIDHLDVEIVNARLGQNILIDRIANFNFINTSCAIIRYGFTTTA